MMTGAILLALLGGAVFDAWEIPLLPGEKASVALADLDGSGRAGLAVARADRLEVYFGARPDARAELPFPKGAACFDVADVNGNGMSEVIALTPEGLYAADVPRPGEAPQI